MRLLRRGVVPLLAAVIIFSVMSAHAAAEDDRDVLWKAVSNCLDSTAFDYCGQCGMPRTERSCPQGGGCGGTMQVWSESDRYVAFRDRIMCDCPEPFLHGLAVPRARVAGIEDPRRPAGIWSFAWSVARARIDDESAIALYVNGPGMRHQDQLHVHIVRLKADARQRFAKLSVSRVFRLDEVWSAAWLAAAAVGIADYGVLVATHPDGGYLVLIDTESPGKYTVARCQAGPMYRQKGGTP